MENLLTSAVQKRTALPLKDSIQDMIRLQRDYDLSDEMFWQIFNDRVLMNKPIDVDDYLRGLYGSEGRS